MLSSWENDQVELNYNFFNENPSTIDLGSRNYTIWGHAPGASKCTHEPLPDRQVSAEATLGDSPTKVFAL
jgi:hypothetical protein